MPLFKEWIGTSSFEVILARQSSHFPTLAFASRTSGSRCIFHTLPRRRSGVDFARSFVSCRKLQLSLFEHCPLPFHCQQSLGLLCSRCLALWFLTTALVSKFPFLASKFFIVKLCSILFFFNTVFYQVQLSSDESPCCTIPLRSWVSPTLVFLICTSFPRCHQIRFASLKKEFRPISNRIPEYHLFEEQL